MQAFEQHFYPFSKSQKKCSGQIDVEQLVFFGNG